MRKAFLYVLISAMLFMIMPGGTPILDWARCS